MRPNLSSKKPFWAFVAVAVVVLFFVFCFRVVGVGQVGIVTRFGQITRASPSGIVIKLPYPIEQLTKMNIKTQKEQQNASAATKDLQTVTTTVALNYHLTPLTARKVFQEVGVNYREIVIDPILQETIKSVSSQYNADQLIGQRSEVEAKLLDVFKEKLAVRGVSVDNVSIVNFNFSAAFDASIEQKQVAQQDAQKAQYQLQTAELKAQAQDVQAKTLTPGYLQLQAIEKWDGKMPTYLGSGAVFNIPLTQ